MKSSVGISHFLEEISSLSHSFVFRCFFALNTEDGFLISPCFSLEVCIQMDLSFSPLLFSSLLFTAICKASSDSHFAFWHFFFLGMFLIPFFCTVSQTSDHSSSGTLSITSSPLNLSLIQLLIYFLAFLLWICKNVVYITWIQVLCFGHVFCTCLPVCGLSFHFPKCSLKSRNFVFDEIKFINFFFYVSCILCPAQCIFAQLKAIFCPMFSSISFTVLAFAFQSLILLELIFLYIVR